MDIDAAFFEYQGQRSAKLTFQVRQQSVHRFKNRDLCAKGFIDARHFTSDHASAHDHHGFTGRQFTQDVIACDHTGQIISVHRDAGRFAACRNDDIFRFNQFIIDADGLIVFNHRMTFDDIDLSRFQGFLDTFSELCDDGVLLIQQSRMIHADVFRMDGGMRLIRKITEKISCMNEGFGGNAAPVETCSADFPFLNQTGFQFRIHCFKRGCVSARTAADNQDIIFHIQNSCSLIHSERSLPISESCGI